MTEVFHNPPGRVEDFVTIEVRVPDASELVALPKLDRTAIGRLAGASLGKEVVAIMGTATISWKCSESRDRCMADHKDGKRLRRWNDVQRYAKLIANGQLPDNGHVYLHPSITGKGNLEVIDGTRRMLAFLVAGRSEMPVVILRDPQPNDGHSNPVA